MIFNYLADNILRVTLIKYVGRGIMPRSHGSINTAPSVIRRYRGAIMMLN